jgi:hypothetical protein
VELHREQRSGRRQLETYALGQAEVAAPRRPTRDERARRSLATQDAGRTIERARVDVAIRIRCRLGIQQPVMKHGCVVREVPETQALHRRSPRRLEDEARVRLARIDAVLRLVARSRLTVRAQLVTLLDVSIERCRVAAATSRTHRGAACDGHDCSSTCSSHRSSWIGPDSRRHGRRTRRARARNGRTSDAARYGGRAAHSCRRHTPGRRSRRGWIDGRVLNRGRRPNWSRARRGRRSIGAAAHSEHEKPRARNCIRWTPAE